MKEYQTVTFQEHAFGIDFFLDEVRKTHGLSVLDVPFWYKGFKKRKRAKKVHITVQK